MGNPFVSGVGQTVSGDIAVPEHERELAFYARVLTTGATPLWRDDLMNNRGIPVIGLGERIPEYEALPLQWMPHIQVADVAASAARALELGGSELMHGKDDDGASQWAVLLDPQGAAFGIIPVIPAEALPADDDAAEPVGCIAGLSLTVPDARAAADFYRQVIGWSLRDVALDDGGEAYSDHDLLDAEGRPAARIGHARGSNQGLPPVWLLHLPVGDLAESLRRVQQDGGQVIRPAQAAPAPPAPAVIRDPVGACLALVAG